MILEAGNLEEARAAILKNAGKKIILKNPSGSHSYAGLLYIKEMFAAARAEFSEEKLENAFDAEDNAAVAIAALKGGFKKIFFCGNAEIKKKIVDIAKQFNAKVI